MEKSTNQNALNDPLSNPLKNAVLNSIDQQSCHEMPSHEEVLVNLRRIEGQIRGIMRMIEERRYCLDILHQCSSVHAALTGVEKKIFKKFLSVCVRRSFEQGDDENLEPLMDDIVKLLSKR